MLIAISQLNLRINLPKKITLLGLIQQVPLEASMGLAAGNSISCHSCNGEQIELEIELIKDNFYNIIFHYNTIYLNIFFSLTMDIE